MTDFDGRTVLVTGASGGIGISPILLAMRFAHLGITVADQVRSRRFYERHFGFDPDQARSYADGTLILRDADGFALAVASGQWSAG
jgi:NAD(P)-dependent dehydrogenase (short-subunit alcohol dehydrogenase family)